MQMNYIVLYFLDCDGPWTPPTNWTVANPVVFLHFEDSTQLTLINGAQLITGKVNAANPLCIVVNSGTDLEFPSGVGGCQHIILTNFPRKRMHSSRMRTARRKGGWGMCGGLPVEGVVTFDPGQGEVL